jgi:uncharacterized protein YndB with AHSA1/START domain
MPTYEAKRELLAPREDVWAFLAEPYNLSDWWPGIGGIQPDRRGLAPGARWQIVGDNRPSFFRKPNMSGLLLVLAVETGRRIAFQLTGERLDVDLTLSDSQPERTSVHLVVAGPALVGLKRSLPTKALDRLYRLVQTAAEA